MLVRGYRAMKRANLLAWRNSGRLMSMDATDSGLYLDLGDNFRDVLGLEDTGR